MVGPQEGLAFGEGARGSGSWRGGGGGSKEGGVFVEGD